MKILTFTFKATNCYLLQTSLGWLMFDACWPDAWRNFANFLKQNGVAAEEIQSLIVSHFHPDHAGLTQYLKNDGTKLILPENQREGIDAANAFFAKNNNSDFIKIDQNNIVTVNCSESRQLLNSFGVNGEIIATPGHSDDSVSLIVDNFCAFIGDLPALTIAAAYNDPVVDASWSQIQRHAIQTIYPSHGPIYEIN